MSNEIQNPNDKLNIVETQNSKVKSQNQNSKFKTKI